MSLLLGDVCLLSPRVWKWFRVCDLRKMQRGLLLACAWNMGYAAATCVENDE